jgi:hypothetical protein
MSNAVKSIFGGTDRSAQRKTEAQNQLSQDFIRSQTGQAQNFLAGALPEMQRATGQGFQGAADVIGQFAPQQIQAQQQGNMAAQAYLLGGLPAFQQAILGQGVNFGQFARNTPMTQIQYDPSMFQRQVYQPNMNPLGGMPQPMGQPMGQQAPQGGGASPQDIARMMLRR